MELAKPNRFDHRYNLMNKIQPIFYKALSEFLGSGKYHYIEQRPKLISQFENIFVDISRS